MKKNDNAQDLGKETGEYTSNQTAKQEEPRKFSETFDWEGEEKKMVPDEEKIAGMLRVQTANHVIQKSANEPDPLQLYPYLIVENELTILFADTGVGKSIFVVQIGVNIASSGHRVLFVDLELSAKQFEKRYRGEDGQLFNFPDTFFRADFTPFCKIPKDTSFEAFFMDSLNRAVDSCNASVIIIDNLTRLVSGDTDNAKAAIPILTALYKLKTEKQKTLIVVEHNKKSDPTRPISLNDLQGSKMKANFSDAVFTIGKSNNGHKIRYLKQLKVRTAEAMYHTDNVANYELDLRNGFLGFHFLGYGSEYEHLRKDKENVKKERLEKAQEMREKGLPNTTIAKEFGVSEAAVRKWLDQ